MILEFYWPRPMSLVIGLTDKFGWTLHADIVLHQHTIMQNRQRSWASNTPGTIKHRRHKYDVVALSFTWTSGCINQGNVLFVDAGRLAVGIGPVLI